MCRWRFIIKLAFPMENFLQFCHQCDLAPLSASAATSRVFSSTCHATLIRTDMSNRLNSVCLFNSYHGPACYVLSSFSVALTTRREDWSALWVQSAFNSTPSPLHYYSVYLVIPAQAALWWLFLETFFSFLKKSNLTAPLKGFDHSKHLTRYPVPPQRRRLTYAVV